MNKNIRMKKYYERMNKEKMEEEKKRQVDKNAGYSQIDLLHLLLVADKLTFFYTFISDLLQKILLETDRRTILVPRTPSLQTKKTRISGSKTRSMTTTKMMATATTSSTATTTGDDAAARSPRDRTIIAKCTL